MIPLETRLHETRKGRGRVWLAEFVQKHEIVLVGLVLLLRMRPVQGTKRCRFRWAQLATSAKRIQVGSH